MKTVRNKTQKPLNILIKKGHVLHLSPNRIGRVSDEALERPSFRRLLERGDIVVLRELRTPEVLPESCQEKESLQGHVQRRAVIPLGGRTSGGRRSRGQG